MAESIFSFLTADSYFSCLPDCVTYNPNDPEFISQAASKKGSLCYRNIMEICSEGLTENCEEKTEFVQIIITEKNLNRFYEFIDDPEIRKNVTVIQTYKEERGVMIKPEFQKTADEVAFCNLEIAQALREKLAVICDILNEQESRLSSLGAIRDDDIELAIPQGKLPITCYETTVLVVKIDLCYRIESDFGRFVAQYYYQN